jgi:hypothetical protein
LTAIDSSPDTTPRLGAKVILECEAPLGVAALPSPVVHRWCCTPAGAAGRGRPPQPVEHLPRWQAAGRRRGSSIRQSAPESIQRDRCQLKDCPAPVLVPEPEVVVGECGSRLGQVVCRPWLVSLFRWPRSMEFKDDEALDISEDQLGRQPDAKAERAADEERRKESTGVAAKPGQGQARKPGAMADRDLGWHHRPKPLS